MTCRPLLACLCLLTAAGCTAGDGKYPSLAPRPIEQRSDAEPVAAPAVAEPDAALDTRLAALRADLDATAKQFAPAAAHAAELVSAAASAGIGSTPWLDAQTALADLDGYRAQSTATLGALDELSIDRAGKLEPAYPALEQLNDAGQAQVDSESATIAELQKKLPGS